MTDAESTFQSLVHGLRDAYAKEFGHRLSIRLAGRHLTPELIADEFQATATEISHLVVKIERDPSDPRKGVVLWGPIEHETSCV